MFADDNEKHGLLIDPQSSHRPSGRKKSKRNPKKYLEKSETNTTPTLQQSDVVTPMAPRMSSAELQISSQMLPQYTLLQGSPRILAPQLSAHLPFQTPLGIQQLQVTPSPPISHRISCMCPYRFPQSDQHCRNKHRLRRGMLVCHLMRMRLWQHPPRCKSAMVAEMTFSDLQNSAYEYSH